MFDTALLESPPISERLAQEVEARSTVTTKVNRPTGEVLRQLVNCPLEGSWDARRSVRVMRTRWVSTKNTAARVVARKKLRSRPVEEPCEPYLLLEGSLHKAMIGHNVIGGPEELLPSLRWFVADTARALGVILPDADAWRLRRIDEAQVYDLGSFEAVQQYIAGIRQAYMVHRGIADAYKDQTVSVPGQLSTVKLYHKGPEFSRHDFARVRDTAGKEIGLELACKLQEQANNLLRVEVELHSKKLAVLYGEIPAVGDLDQARIEACSDRETARLLREAKSEMDTVRTHQAVAARLRDCYGDTRGRAQLLLGLWFRLATMGEQEVRRQTAPATLRRNMKLLQEAGCSWLATDVHVLQMSAIPEGFSPRRTDPRRLIGQAPEISAMLAAYRVAA